MKLTPATDQPGENIGAEQLLALNPEVILYVNFDGSSGKELVKKIYANPSLQSLSAVANKQIHLIEFNTFMTYSFNIIDGLEQLAKELYPDQF